MFDNRESHKIGVPKKYPVNACGMRDGLSGDMLALSRPNLVYQSWLADSLESFSLSLKFTETCSIIGISS